MSWYLVAGIAVIALVVIVSRRSERPDSSRARSGSTPPSAQRIDELLRIGQKIEAINEFRALHGVDLKAAKDAVEARASLVGDAMRQMNGYHPLR